MKIFNEIAADYQKIREKITYPAKLYEFLAGLTDKHDSALDIGCGNGVSSVMLTKHFRRVTGIDLGEALIKHAKENYPKIEFMVCKAEDAEFRQKFDLITSATSFYWMEREQVIAKMPSLLRTGGVFCCYKYDFPLIYGKLRDIINLELANKWQEYRDKRLIEYDDSYDLLVKSGNFTRVEEFIIPNIIELTTVEIAKFFLSTSYVANYIKSSNNSSYPAYLIQLLEEHAGKEKVKVRFDIYGTYAST